MTREEAIRHIGDVINIENNSIKPIVIFEQEKEALYMAIEALQNLSKPNNELKGSDLISRQDALAEFQDGRDVYDIMESIEELPSAPDSRQRGEWVRLEREENVYDLHGVPTWGVNYMCDKCGFITTAIQDHFGQYRWCPSCGARMKGGEEE